MDRPLTFVQEALKTLDGTPPDIWAMMWVDLRMEFARKYTGGYIFSTRFGSRFFDGVEHFLSSNAFLEPEAGQELGEYDKNFNRWLKAVRSTKQTI